MSYEHETGASRRAKVLKLLLDGRWHTTSEIESAHVGGSQGTRRLRELRAAGYRIVKQKCEQGTQYEYSLVQQRAAPVQQDLFA